MSTKKRTSKRTKKQTPSKAMLEEIAEVFEKHDWVGTTIWMPERDSTERAMNVEATALDSGGLAPTPSSLNCSPPEKPTFISKRLEDGTLVSGWACR
jgi:hypothetical protein